MFVLASWYVTCIPFQKKHHLDPLSKENLDIGFPIYFIIQNGWKQNVFHSFWELLTFLDPTMLSGPPFKKASSRPPFKRKLEQGFPLYFTFSEWGEPLSNLCLKGGPDNILGFKKGKNSQNEWNAFCFQPFWNMKYKLNPYAYFLLKGGLDDILGLGLNIRGTPVQIFTPPMRLTLFDIVVKVTVTSF
jgi:hypothetical protein